MRVYVAVHYDVNMETEPDQTVRRMADANKTNLLARMREHSKRCHATWPHWDLPSWADSIQDISVQDRRLYGNPYYGETWRIVTHELADLPVKKLIVQIMEGRAYCRETTTTEVLTWAGRFKKGIREEQQ